ncbi:MAG TPA: tetratricopeptide repeat protein [Methanomicrobiales archaeon]|nr:tetratricopeptide repeat protein [Methanomicrobiales archaeon]
MTPKEPEPRRRGPDLPDLTVTPGIYSPYPGDGIGRGPGPGHRGGRSPSEAAASDPAATAPTDTTGIGAVYDRVSALLESGRTRDAEKILSKGLEIYPESVDLLKEQGVLYHLQGRYGKAARTFTRVMNITGEGMQSLAWKLASLSNKALEEFGGPDPARSLATYDEILALDPQDREALSGKIAALRVLGRLDEATRLVEAATSLDPPGPSILYQEGWLRMDLDQPEPARGAFGRAALADPDWPDPVFSEALALVRLGRGREAETLLGDFEASVRGVPGLRAELGWCFLMLHNPARAKEIFLQVARADGDTGGFQGLAALLLALGRTSDAAAIMGRLSRAMPRDPLVQANHGLVLAREGGPESLADASVSARKALDLDPRCGPAHSCLGIVAFRQGKPDAAGAHFAEATRLSDPSGPRNQGLLACARGRWTEAEPHLLRAIRLDPLDARAWAGLGAVALQTGRPGEAVLHLRRAVTLDPRGVDTARGLAIALARCGDQGRAEDVLRRTLALTPGPERWLLLLDLAAHLVSMGGPAGSPVLDEEARQLLGEAGALRPGVPGILFFEGVVESRLGNRRKAMDLFSASMAGEEFRRPALENMRRLKSRMRVGRRILTGVSWARYALAAFSLLQLAALWMFFVARLVSETSFVLLIAIFSLLFALSVLIPARNGETKKERPLEFVIPERSFVPSPEAEMASPLIRLRTSLRP